MTLQSEATSASNLPTSWYVNGIRLNNTSDAPDGTSFTENTFTILNARLATNTSVGDNMVVQAEITDGISYLWSNARIIVQPTAGSCPSCGGNEVCTRTMTGFECKCIRGYAGQNCEDESIPMMSPLVITVACLAVPLSVLIIVGVIALLIKAYKHST
ncbi:uncharacterized protein LOC141911206 [Tubulanus polymorphus]|uniref:uncharacterized protein LOC141911206 n=1 Tax=Tubulanus polymorphus TaxID=672921 RepID=UPI003DA4C0F3